ncbi:MAG: polyphosphate kinase 1, partial [Chlorobi bacterium]|nr:polyphosphate kinase 1 [Chlorobiota bacterium]
MKFSLLRTGTMTEEIIDQNNDIDLNSKKLFLNRELSLIEFNKRVLAEAMCEDHPLLERLKFISILSSNLDEFFMIRVAGLKRQVAAGVVDLTFDGMTPQEQLDEIRLRLDPLYKQQESIFMDKLLPALEHEGIYIHHSDDMTPDESKKLSKHFRDCILPILTPLSLDSSHPFPRLINRSLNIAFVLTDNTKKIGSRRVAFLQIPVALPRLVALERPSGHHFVLLEQIIKDNANILFPGLQIEDSNTFRVTRDADIEIADDEAEDLLKEIAEQIIQRRWGTAPVKLEVSENMPDYLVRMLLDALELEEIDLYIHDRPLKLPDFMQLVDLNIRHLKDTPFQTRILPELIKENMSIFNAVKKKDLLVHHPFDSFTNSVLNFLKSASVDPDVIAIKITLYRTGSNSPIVKALMKAAENGKEVTAFVELKARFDEENNMSWAKELEHMGVHVIYGVLGLKTHCKIAVVVRRENKRLNTYLHLSTGNYNYTTSQIYTDIGLFTTDELMVEDAINLFNYLTGYSNHKNWNRFLVAPVNMREQIIQSINREAELHTEKNPGMIFAKMNSLAHAEVIRALYKASQKGVKIKLLVRGICCLKPGMPGVSDNIEVRSVIGRFLEHSRIFYFKAGGKDEYYLSSADWMTRNLHKRVELAFPIRSKSIRKQLGDLLNTYWDDNSKSWVLSEDGTFKLLQITKDSKKLSAQEYLLRKT